MTAAPPTSKATVDKSPTTRSVCQMVLHARVVTETGGGPDKTILNSPRFLEGTNYRAECAYLYPPNDPGFAALQKLAETSGAKLHGIEDRGPLDWRVVRDLAKLCRSLKVKIWHGHDYKTNALGLLLRRFHRMHLVTTVHGWVKHTSRTPLYYWIDRKTLPLYDKVVCVSADLEEQCLLAGVKRDRCHLIENAIDTTQARRTLTREEAKVASGYDPAIPLIGAVGRLSEEKGFDLLIEAVGRLHAMGNPVHLAIVGEGDQRQALETQIAAQTHPDRFHLVGFRGTLGTFYQALDVFALSSRREGLPNVLLEAMAYEAPVVATAVAGIPRLITDGMTGCLIAPNDVPQLQEALARVLAEGSLQRSFSQAARQTIVTRYDFAVRMQKMRSVYDELFF